MTDDNDLVKRLRKRQEFEFIDGYKRIEWEDDDALEAADRIEELEAKLAKAVKALDRIAGKAPYADDPYDIARAALTELNGDKP
jgi:translation elongation factor EF-Ts